MKLKGHSMVAAMPINIQFLALLEVLTYSLTACRLQVTSRKQTQKTLLSLSLFLFSSLVLQSSSVQVYIISIHH